MWVQDETRVGQQGSLTRIWSITGTRPRIVRQQQFMSTYIYGASCPRKKKAVGLILPYANSVCMNMHLKEISLNVERGCHAVIIVDQARWHTSGLLEIPQNISLLPLPPYSPELNSQENVWQWIKDKYLSNRVFKTFEEINDAAVEGWNKFSHSPELIFSLTNRKWTAL